MNDFIRARLIVSIPLKQAALCASCESVFVIPDWDHCPACSDSHWIPLESVIGTIRTDDQREDALRGA